MELISSTLIAIGLAMDSFAVSLGVGTSEYSAERRSRLRLAFHFGLFQGGMTALGWLAGTTISRYIQQFDHWIAFFLLLYVGSNLIRSGIHPESSSYCQDPFHGKVMIVLCVATSIDALAVGLSMAMIHSPILIPALIITAVTFSLSIFGINAGNHLGQKFGKNMEILGGIILIAIGVRILITHLF